MSIEPNMVACCDDRHRTPFCPSCGRNLRERAVVDEILCSFAAEIKKRRTTIQNLESEPKSTRDHKRLESVQKSLQKFERWRDEVRHLKMHSQQNT